MMSQECINEILCRYDPAGFLSENPDEYANLSQDLFEHFCGKKTPYKFKRLYKELFSRCDACLSYRKLDKALLEKTVHAIWKECFNRYKYMTPSAIRAEQIRYAQWEKEQELERYPTVKPSPFDWGVESQWFFRSSRKPPSTSEPRLWLVSTGDKAWLVNMTGEPITKLVSSRGGWGGGDTPCTYNAEEDWVYTDVPHGCCALVDKWDWIISSDFFLLCELLVETPSLGAMTFHARGREKGTIDRQIFLWDASENEI